MDIQHPRSTDAFARGPPSQAAVPVGGNRYSTVAVDSGGYMSISETHAERVMDSLAASYGVTYDDDGNVVVDDGISREELIATIESGTVPDIADLIDAGDFDDRLDELAKIEADREDRTGVQDAIESRRDEIEG